MYKTMSIEEYATSQHSEENWLVRFLNNEMSDVLDDRHLDTAKEVLASKCLVGLTEELTGSFYRSGLAGVKLMLQALLLCLKH